MELDFWDEEFDKLKNSVDELEEKLCFSENNEKANIIAQKKRSVSESESHILNLHIRFKRLTEVTLCVPKRLRALVYWGSEISNLVLSLMELYDTYLKQFMWIQLFKNRLLGETTGHKSYLVSESELEAMKDTLSSLKDMHYSLRKEHDQLLREEAQLRRNYNELQTEEENYMASQSLPDEWGEGAIRAQRNPVIEEVSKLFYGVAFKTCKKVRETRQINMLTKDLYSRSRVVLDECRTLMSLNDRNTKPHFDGVKVKQIKESLKHLRHLEQKLDNLTRSTLPQNHTSSPILLKKSTIQVTTGAENVS